MPPRSSPLVRVPTEPLDVRFGLEPAGSAREPRAPALRRARVVAPDPNSPSEAVPEADSATYTLSKYLQESWFPALKFGPRAKQEFIWPHYPELQAPPGTRKLRTISRIMPYHIHGSACFYLERQEKRIIRPLSEASRDLALPSVTRVWCDEKDNIFYMQDVNFVTDITKVLLVSVLSTVARCLYMLLDIPDGEEADYFRSLVRFKSSFGMCPVQDKNFDVVSLASPHAGRTSMIILIIPPWALDNMDFISFIKTGPVTPGSLDAFPAGVLASSPCTIWAILWDMCFKYNCHFFAVTTYEHWAFGNFTSDMENGYISDLFRAPIHPYDGVVRRDMLPSPTMTETLIFWMAACMGIEGINWKPFCDKVVS